MVAANTFVELPGSVRDELVAHARDGDPDEVCGILAGHDCRVERLYRVRNIAEQVDQGAGVFRDRQSGAAVAGRAAVHYYMDPKDQLRVTLAIDDQGLDVVGYYHSHTHTEARPSPTDIRLAPDLGAVYFLVGLEDRAKPSVRAWRIVKENLEAEVGEAVEVQITLV